MMNGGHDGAPDEGHPQSHRAANGRAAFYRADSNHSSASVFEDVEMAQDEVRLITPVDSPDVPACRPAQLPP